jgi:hypothetical protein|tara:strand:- start:64 stop:483 length:420 start_codon:yes stop_codon:yes gene_type:complete
MVSLQDAVRRYNKPSNKQNESGKASSAMNVVAEKVGDVSNNYKRIYEIRPVKRDNTKIKGWTGEQESSVLLAQSDNLAFPMLFPKDPNNPTSNPEDWIEFDKSEWRQALNLAKSRKEVFEFTTEKEAIDFAEGSWKTVK